MRRYMQVTVLSNTNFLLNINNVKTSFFIHRDIKKFSLYTIVYII